MQETPVRSLGWEDPLEKGKATHSSILAWRILWTTVHGVAKSQTWLRDFHFNYAICLNTLNSSFKVKGIQRWYFVEACPANIPIKPCLLYCCCCLIAKLCLTLCDPTDCSPGSSVHGISQARILEWVAIFSSRGSSRPRDWTCVTCIGRQIPYLTEAPGKFIILC